MRFLRFCLPIVLAACALPSHAADTITMAVSGLNCKSTSFSTAKGTANLLSWSWGVYTPSTVQLNVTAGQPDLSQLVVTKTFDGCSPGMLDFYLSGTKLGTVTVTQTKPGGTSGTPVAMIVLTNAWFSSYGVGGSAASPASEAWTLSFDKVCVTTYVDNPNGTYKEGEMVCYP